MLNLLLLHPKARMEQFDLRMCPNCHASPLIWDHPTLHGWVKCVLCGFSEKKPVKKSGHGTKQRKK